MTKAEIILKPLIEGIQSAVWLTRLSENPLTPEQREAVIKKMQITRSNLLAEHHADEVKLFYERVNEGAKPGMFGHEVESLIMGAFYETFGE